MLGNRITARSHQRSHLDHEEDGACESSGIKQEPDIVERKKIRAPVSDRGKNYCMRLADPLTDWRIGYTRALWTRQQSEAIGQTFVERLLVARALSGFLSNQRKTFLRRSFVERRLELHQQRNHNPRSKPCGISTASLVNLRGYPNHLLDQII